MRKIALLPVLCVLAAVIGAAYGALHNQISYSISPEYFTKLKFEQFGLSEVGREIPPQEARKGAAIVGALATWWVAFLAALVLGIFGLMYPTAGRMFWAVLGALGRGLVWSAAGGAVGWAIGFFVLSAQPQSAFGMNLPENLTDYRGFVTAAMMHNGGYIGAGVGILMGVVSLFRRRGRHETAATPPMQPMMATTVGLHYHNRRFRPVSQSANSETNAETVFVYRQEGRIVTSEYSGGGIQKGHLMGLVADDGVIEMRYHQVNVQGELMTGVCRSVPEVLPDGRVRLHEQWRWTSGDLSAGRSILEEF